MRFELLRFALALDAQPSFWQDRQPRGVDWLTAFFANSIIRAAGGLDRAIDFRQMIFDPLDGRDRQRVLCHRRVGFFNTDFGQINQSCPQSFDFPLVILSIRLKLAQDFNYGLVAAGSSLQIPGVSATRFGILNCIHGFLPHRPFSATVTFQQLRI